LKYEGISELPPIKTSGNYRARNGKVTVSSSKEAGIKIGKTDSVKSILENTAEGTTD